MQKTVTRTIQGIKYTDIVMQGKTLDPETEEVMFGDELKNDYRVLCCDLTMTDAGALEDLVRYRNRWATVKRIRHEDSGVYFVLKYDDGDMVIRQCAPSSAWWVTKESIAAVEVFEKLQAEQAKKNGPFAGLKLPSFAPKSKPGEKTDEEIDNDGTPVSGVAYEAPEPPAENVDPDPTGIFNREELIERHGEPTRTTGAFETNEPGGPIHNGTETHDEPMKAVGGVFEV